MSAFETQEWEGFETPGEWEALEWGEMGQLESQEHTLGEMFGGEMESLGEMQEFELANELLEVASEEELEQFLGKLLRGAAKAAGGMLRSPIGRALGGTLKGVAKAALPMAAGALGNMVLPGIGGMVGSQLGSMASKMFELELEGLGEQEAELEVARRYVRFATAAARNAARAPSGAPPRAVVRAAVLSAARRHAPGLVRRPPGRWNSPHGPRQGGYGFGADGADGIEPSFMDSDADLDATDATSGTAQTGRWVRRGRKIVILGA
ncbi:hypothetical protein [Alloactinosynnema sp. L-07]|uniref:hypothetical protein n=1 Tax=Alloactinosynnema sp. L-07 TaxID=1653480 RepID=UPI00065EFD96|nr:hypothetical protein [Alloactinosynnema sp. L-07]CRK59236.1 hypothetical protein [Alloactinosynnema sp. L-07]